MLCYIILCYVMLCYVILLYYTRRPEVWQCSLGSFASQDFGIALRNLLWKLCGELLRFAETVILPPCKMTNKYRGDVRRRRIRAKTAQNNVKILARKTP